MLHVKGTAYIIPLPYKNLKKLILDCLTKMNKSMCVLIVSNDITLSLKSKYLFLKSAHMSHPFNIIKQSSTLYERYYHLHFDYFSNCFNY